MFSMELLAWWSLAVSICAAALAGLAFLESRKADLQLRKEVEWQKLLWKDSIDRINNTDLMVVDLGQATGFKLAEPKPATRANAWERSL